MDRIRLPSLLPRWLEDLGIQFAAVLRQAHTPPEPVQPERINVSAAQWFGLWQTLRTISDDPALGLKIRKRVRVEQYDPVRIAALSARSFHDSLTKLARYKGLFCSEAMRVVVQDGLWRVESAWITAQEAAPPLLIDSMFAALMELGQRGSGQALYPERLEFARKPLQQALYEAYFHCPVAFSAGSNVMVYSRQAMDQPFRTANPDLLAMLVPQLEVALREEAAQQNFTDQVKMLLRSRLVSKQPTIQDIARELSISPRTLQRQLADQGTGFQQVLEAVRREMAQQYLTASALDLNEIAYMLGYEEASSFHRAFHHWEGTSPGQWRAAHHQVGFWHY